MNEQIKNELNDIYYNLALISESMKIFRDSQEIEYSSAQSLIEILQKRLFEESLRIDKITREV